MIIAGIIVGYLFVGVVLARLVRAIWGDEVLKDGDFDAILIVLLYPLLVPFAVFVGLGWLLLKAVNVKLPKFPRKEKKNGAN